ncbi:hypothetical protein QJ798_02765 [Staphylococcus hominis]|uniref:hypothetical protein n=1 Tax=Staphylococcus hominis TaxID=1290 RepID=UPI001F59062B|nr:hypothetical protein [Staphylococcus hominis]MCI2899615.1 hypothetical protein [Staphylococcus hominis]MEB5793070.1 hypothetical protein [Staphylococcus hominis]
MKKDTFNTLFKNPSSNKIKSMMLSNDDFDESKNSKFDIFIGILIPIIILFLILFIK